MQNESRLSVYIVIPGGDGDGDGDPTQLVRVVQLSRPYFNLGFGTCDQKRRMAKTSVSITQTTQSFEYEAFLGLLHAVRNRDSVVSLPLGIESKMRKTGACPADI